MKINKLKSVFIESTAHIRVPESSADAFSQTNSAAWTQSGRGHDSAAATDADVDAH